MRNVGIQIRISDILFALRKRWKTIIFLTAAGLIFGMALSGMSYIQSSLATYQISGSFAVTTLNGNGEYSNGVLRSNENDYHLAEDMVDAVSYVIRSREVVNAAINDMSLLGVVTDDIKENLTLTQYSNTQIMEMTLIWRSPEEGIDIWNAIVEASNRVLPRTLQLGALAVINSPESEIYGAAGSSSQTVMLLAVMGFIAGLGFALMELLLHPTLNNVRDVEPLFGLETLGTIPRDPSWNEKNGRVLSQDEASPTVQSYAAAAYILRNRLGRKEKHNCFYVTSSTAKEGKSTVAANLAVQLSSMECHTLLIDFDTRNPSLGGMFLDEVDYARSLNALYRGEATEQDAIIHINGYLDLLPTVLEHNAMPLDGTIEDLIKDLIDKYDYVIIDSAPVGIVSETLSLNQVTNTALFVIGYDSAVVPDIQNSVEKMDKSGVRLVGCIVNGVVSHNGGDKGRYGPQKKPVSKKKKRTSNKKQEESFVRPAETTDALKALTKAPAKANEAKEAKPEKPAEPQSAPADAPAPAEKKAVKPRKKEAPKPALTADAIKKAIPSKPRSVMDDLMASEPVHHERSDSDTMSALLKMGMEGDFNNSDKEE